MEMPCQYPACGKANISAADIAPLMDEMLANGETDEIMTVDAEDDLVIISLE